MNVLLYMVVIKTFMEILTKLVIEMVLHYTYKRPAIIWEAWESWNVCYCFQLLSHNEIPLTFALQFLFIVIFCPTFSSGLCLCCFLLWRMVYLTIVGVFDKAPWNC